MVMALWCVNLGGRGRITEGNVQGKITEVLFTAKTLETDTKAQSGWCERLSAVGSHPGI